MLIEPTWNPSGGDPPCIGFQAFVEFTIHPDCPPGWTFCSRNFFAPVAHNTICCKLDVFPVTVAAVAALSSPGTDWTWPPTYDVQDPDDYRNFHVSGPNDGSVDGCTDLYEVPVCPPHFCYCRGNRKCVDCNCPSGTHWDHDACGCLFDVPPPGMCWCYYANQYVPCVDPLCKAELHCAWSVRDCQWVCDAPNCAFDHYWRSDICACYPCPPGKCRCESTNQCEDCSVTPDCATELHCAWDVQSCAWVCDAPICPDGQVFNYCICACVPLCPDGQQWCDADDACQDAPDPPCKSELRCVWCPDSCSWRCDDPDAKCGPDKPWDPVNCRCDTRGRSWHRQLAFGKFYRTVEVPEGIRFQRAERNLPLGGWDSDDLAVADSAAIAARFDVDESDGRIYLGYITHGDVKLVVGDGDGDALTWGDPMTLFSGAKHHDVCTDPLTKAKFFTARITASGEYRLRVQYPGHDVPEPAVVMRDTAGAPIVLDDEEHHVEAAHDEFRLTLSGTRGGNAVVMYSDNDGETWGDT